MGLRRYRELLRVPGLRPLMLAVSLGRLPYGMNILAEILLLRAAGFDYAVVGVVTAASGLSVGLAAPVMGRVIDRVGQTKVLLTAAVFTAISGTAFVVAVLEGAGATLGDVLAFLTGLIVPPVSPSLRALLPGLVGRERLDTAFALDALLLELVFITGPLLAAGIATAISPEVAFLTGVAFQAAGGLGVAASPHSRAWRPAPREPGTRRKGALTTAGIRVLVLTLALTAVSLGVLEIAIAAFAEEHGTRDDAGWLFTLWSVGSLAGGLWYGAREWRAAARTCASSLVTAVLTAGLAPLPLAGSMPVFARARDRGRARPRALDGGGLLADRRPRPGGRGHGGLLVADRRLRRRQRGRRLARGRGRRARERRRRARVRAAGRRARPARRAGGPARDHGVRTASGCGADDQDRVARRGAAACARSSRSARP